MDFHYEAKTPAMAFDGACGAAKSGQLEALDIDQYPIGLQPVRAQ